MGTNRESGTPLIGVPGSGTCGTLSSGVLESSNVDITSELVNLMTAQRNYQANTKVIATSTQLDDALFRQCNGPPDLYRPERCFSDPVRAAD